MGRELRCGEGGKKEETCPDFSENRGGWGNKKSHGKRRGLPWLHLIAMFYTDGFVSTI